MSETTVFDYVEGLTEIPATVKPLVEKYRKLVALENDDVSREFVDLDKLSKAMDRLFDMMVVLSEVPIKCVAATATPIMTSRAIAGTTPPRRLFLMETSRPMPGKPPTKPMPGQPACNPAWIESRKYVSVFGAKLRRAIAS